MKKKIFILLFAYSYVTLVFYVGSENALTLAKAQNEKKKYGKRGKIKIESLWKTTIKRFKEYFEIVFKD